jgi:hypothetical protein
MGLTWVAIIASLFMGSGALLIFIWAVRSNLFHNFEDVKYQVFWSDLQDQVDAPVEEQQDGSGGTNARTS